MNKNASHGRLPLNYFVLVFILSIPFWLIGGNKLPLPVNLPVSALMFINPVIAASILSYKRDGFNGIKELLQKALDTPKIKNKIWYLPIMLLMPLIYFLSYAVMRLTGLPLPAPINIPILLAPVFFVMYFIAAMCEEVGWMGYAINSMQHRWGALKASVILGAVWAIWHSIPYAQTGNPANWIVWHSLSAVALRILIVWIYNNTGKSVFATILFHDMVNVSWSLFPNYGSHYDPFVTGTIIWAIAGVVIFGWGAKTLARCEHTSPARLQHPQ